MKNFYTYRVTFPGFKWYYYGYHKNNWKPYSGSPVTHKWIWEFYEFEVQILEWFETREQAIKIEKRLIKPFLNDPWCLNEHCGGSFGEVALRKSVETRLKNNINLFSSDWNPSTFETCSKGGKVGGATNKGSGHAAKLYTYRDPEEHSEWGKELARKTNSTMYKCPSCGRVANIGGITRHLRAKSNTCSGEPIKIQ